MYSIEKTRLFKQVPRNYWSSLMALVHEKGASSPLLGIYIDRGDNPILLDYTLKSAFYWKETRQGHDFWHKIHSSTIGKM